MGVNIKIPYLESIGETPMGAYQKIYFIARTITNYLIAQKGNFVVADPVSFMLKHGDNFLKIGETFLDIAKTRKDSNSAYSLFRVQADYLATLLLIFEGKSEDEIKFRYLLYLKDGISQRIKSLRDIPPFNGSISKEDYDRLVKQMSNALKNAEETFDFCTREIDKLPYKNINPVLFDKIVQNSQWKYKEFNDTLTKCEQFKWKDLYYLIDSRPDIASFISLCSHYIHGNVNSLLSDEGEDAFDPIINFNAILIERYIDMLRTLYGKEEINKIIEFCLFGITVRIC